MTRFIFLLLVLLWSWPPAALAQSEAIGLYVGNQGNFFDANGSVSFIDPATLDTEADLLTGLNTLVQSITLHRGTGYVMANSSDRIDLFSMQTRQRTGQIVDIASPRYLTVVGNDRAYVSNLFNATVTIIDLAAGEVDGTIPVGDNPEGIAVAGGRVYVANHGFGAGQTLSVIDAATDAVLGSVEPGCDGPRMLAADLEGELWVMCTGNTVYNEDFTEIISQTNGRVVVLEGATGEVLLTFEASAQLGSGNGGQDLYYDLVSRRLFVIQGLSLLVFDTAANAPLPPVLIPGEDPIGAVAYDDATSRLFLGRVPGFTQAGYVSVHDPLGREMDRLTVGISPTSIAVQYASDPVAVEVPGAPFDLALEPGYPNPFDREASFPILIEAAASVRVAVYDLLGREIDLLTEGSLAPGRHALRWQPRPGTPAGMYLVRLERDGHTKHTRILYLP